MSSFISVCVRRFCFACHSQSGRPSSAARSALCGHKINLINSGGRLSKKFSPFASTFGGPLVATCKKRFNLLYALLLGRTFSPWFFSFCCLSLALSSMHVGAVFFNYNELFISTRTPRALLSRGAFFRYARFGYAPFSVHSFVYSVAPVFASGVA